MSINNTFFNSTEGMQRNLDGYSASVVAITPGLGSLPSVAKLFVSLGQYTVGKYTNNPQLLQVASQNTSDALFQMIPVFGRFIAASRVEERNNSLAVGDELYCIGQRIKTVSDPKELLKLQQRKQTLKSLEILQGDIAVLDTKVKEFFNLSKEEQAKLQKEYPQWINDRNVLNTVLGELCKELYS